MILIVTGCATSTYNRANQMYGKTAYAEAAELYEKALQKGDFPDAELKLADSYRRMNNLVKAEKYYNLALEKAPDKFGPEERLHFAQVLKANEKYEEAKAMLEAYLELQPSDLLAQNILHSCDSAICFRQETLNYQVKKLKHPEKLASAFSPVLYKNGLLYVAETKSGRQYEWTGYSYLHLYYSDVTEDSLAGFEELPGKINSRYHEGPSTFSPDGSTLWFTRSFMEKNRVQKNDQDVNHLGIYTTRLVKGKWKNIQPFPYNDRNYSTGHPTLSADGKHLFFISDKPGGFGGTDIYTSQKTEEGWSEPRNLGPEINSPGNEMFPTTSVVEGEEFLYFSSDGHKGMGGLDIFRTELNSAGTTSVEHPGRPINSPGDDFSFILSEDGHSGYFSSNRDSKSGKDELYSFIQLKPEFYLDGQVINGLSGTTLPWAKLVLRDLTTGKEYPLNAGREGRFRKRLEKDHKYKLFAWKDEFDADSIEFSTAELKPGERIHVELKPQPYAYIEGLVLNKQTGKPVEDAVVDVHIPCLKKKMTIKTKNGGKYRVKVDRTKECVVTGKKQNFYADTKEIVPAMFADTNVVVSELTIEKIEVNKTIRLDHIYYDYNSANLTKDAVSEVDKLVNLLKRNPEIHIEISSHTDSRGGDSYNLKLSQKRAEAVVAYIISKGIDPARLTAKGYGESMLLNDCKNGAPCSEEEHQYNRRTEFKVMTIESGQDKP